MSDKTGISWTDTTWNPIRGCSRVSEGCRNCYAETTASRFCGPGQPYDGLITTLTRDVRQIGIEVRNGAETGENYRFRTIQRREARWTGEVRLVAEHLSDPLRWRKPRKIFVNSMSDLFHESLSNEQIAAVFGVMAAAPQHTFQILTKRARRMREWFEWAEKRADDGKELFAADNREWRIWQMLNVAARRAGAELPSHHGGAWPLPNVWLGVSVENQAVADERIPDLLATPAALRFLSCEPLLGPLDVSSHIGLMPSNTADFSDVPGVRDGIDWAIAGCESGPGARPCEVEWLRSLRDQCAAAEVPFFLKQAKPVDMGTSHIGGMSISLGSDPFISFGPGSKHKRGVIELPYLDGVQHAAFPEVRS